MDALSDGLPSILKAVERRMLAEGAMEEVDADEATRRAMLKAARQAAQAVLEWGQTQ